MSQPGKKAHQLVVRTRQREYSERQRNEETRTWSDVIVGHGFETVQEITVSEEGLAIWNSWGELERKDFLATLDQKH